MKPFYEVVIRPVVTEKSVAGREGSLYTFEVAVGAGKAAIREAIENFFKVDVVRVRTMRVHGKRRRVGRHVGFRPSWKKAVVALKAGQKIKTLEGE